MKKFMFFAAAAVVLFASCNKQETASVNDESLQKEMSVLAFNANRSKGYTGWTSGQTAFEEVADPEATTTKTDRAMRLAVSCDDGVLFTNEAFKKDASDGMWHATPKKYYPVGQTKFDFLAYSVGTDANYIGEFTGTDKITMQVGESFYQDDIIYSANEVNGAQSEAVAMKFGHAQAWINMNLYLKKGTVDGVKFKVNSITWKNIKNEGVLTILPSSTVADVKATCSWSFFGIDAKDVAMDDAHNVLAADLQIAAADTPTPAELAKLNMLLPAQNHTTFVINYTIGEGAGAQTFDYEYKTPATTTWEAGKKYVYNIGITVYEITVNPSVVAFDIQEAEEIDVK